ncbi:addiction module antidote protein, HigA family [Candidatus Peregrinibacteria bacterium CG10_big_fil_rev_8_21_14_0_10_36_19]|nr:MAG: addiction module antidote protein, HigA family [Candidatus Peregrinibacteria bacterium CG10_big_fil_rev_8_21_14_0_10_36_19]
MKRIPPTHPGKTLLEDFLKPLKISQYRLAHSIGVTPMRISEIVRGVRSVSPDTALRFQKFFGLEAEFWLKLQSHYDLEIAKKIIAHDLKYKVKVLKKLEKTTKDT